MPVPRETRQNAAAAAPANPQNQPKPARSTSQPAPAAGSRTSSASPKTEYKPTEDTLMRLNRLPKDEIRKMLGFDIDYLIAHTRMRGVLEALAYGAWTPPIKVAPSWGKSSSGYISCRIWQSEKDGQVKWGVEDAIPVATRFVQDRDGNPVLNEYGKPKMEFDRNELTVSTTSYSGVTYEGKPLSREQVLHLKLTGHLGEPMIRVDPVSKKTVTEIVDCHPYNNQRLIKVNADVVIARLKRDPTFRTKNDTFNLTDRQIGELSLGRGVWVGTQKEGNCAYIQYDIASGKLRFANEYSQALRKFNAERQNAKERAEMSQGLSASQREQASESRGPRP